MRIPHYLIFILLLLTACTPKRHSAFYFWKTNFSIDQLSQKYLDSLHVKSLYVRFFDVDIEGDEPMPVAHIIIHEQAKNQEIVPVVFITNRTFIKLDKTKIERLAQNIVQEIDYLYPKISVKKIQEIQFDCDWTMMTKSKYFYFLNLCKLKKLKIQFSTTIRLHQVKDYKQTGIPPVNKGVLMYYASSNPLDFTEQNSILENATADNYLNNLQDYPLKLDVAFPIYSWAILDDGYGNKKLLDGIRLEDLKDTSVFVQQKQNFFTVKKDTYWKGVYLYKDYQLKVEEVSFDQLQKASLNFNKKCTNRELNTIFFQLDSSNLMHYSIQQLSTLANPKL